MQQPIIKDMKVTKDKVILRFRRSQDDRYLHELVHDSERSEEMRRHIDAIAYIMVDEADALAEADKRQSKMEFETEPCSLEGSHAPSGV